MYYLDHRLSKILSDIRIEQAESLRKRNRSDHKRNSARQRIGLLLITQGEKLAGREAKAA